MTEIDIGARRHEAGERLEQLRHQQGVALLDGKQFEDVGIAELEREMSALDVAEGEQLRRHREAQAAAEKERLANLRQTLSIVEEQRLEAVDRAETAARDLCEAVKEALARSADAARLLRALNVSTIQLDTYEAEFRLSVRITCALKPLAGIKARFGQISFPAARAPFDEPWRPAEAAIAEPNITRALKGSF
jgi:hypothetical protein